MCNILVPNMTRRRNGNDPILVLPSFDSLSLPFRKSPSSFGNLDIHELSLTIEQIYENATSGPLFNLLTHLFLQEKKNFSFIPFDPFCCQPFHPSLYVIYQYECFNIQIVKFNKNSSAVRYNSQMIGSSTVWFKSTKQCSLRYHHYKNLSTE